ncbi:MAG: sulfotransferase, partial [Flavobacteriales bacterium]
MSPLHAIAIHGAPRSGTSWLGEIFKSSPKVAYRYQPLFSYAFKGRLSPASTAEEIEAFYRDLWATDDPFVLQRDPRIHPDHPQAAPAADATHLVYKEVRYHHIVHNLLDRSPITRLVAIIRDPRAVIDSWMRAPSEFKAGWDIMREW